MAVQRFDRSLRTAVRALLVGLALCQAGPLHAATFTVSPTQVYLSAKVTSALVTLRNESQEALRFQLTMRAWDQKPNGEMALSPTQDIVFFPQLLSLAAGEERKVRVGLGPGLAVGPAERTYRLFVEELPPSEGQAQTQGVRVLTKMGIPIFVQPASAAPRAVVRDLKAAAGRIGFVVANTGTAHFVPDAIAVEGVASDGRVLFSQSVKTWYVLAGGTREFDLEIPKNDCSQLKAVTVTMRIGTSSVTERAQAATGACQP